MKTFPLGIAIIGTGRAGLIHAGNFARSVPGARLVAVADPVAESLAQAQMSLNVELGFADYRSDRVCGRGSMRKNRRSSQLIAGLPIDDEKPASQPGDQPPVYWKA
jgi:hypothetical protein